MCTLFSVRRVGFLAAFLLLFVCPLLANSQTNRFILLGDIHYDQLEDHDFEWLEANSSPDNISQINTYSAITEANWDDFMTHLQGVVETNAPSIKAVIQLGDISQGLAGPSKADQMAASVMEAVEQSGLGVPWILAKGNHDVTFAPDAKIAFNNNYLPMIRKQTGDDSIQMANYSYRSGSVEIFVCDYYERNSVDPIAWLDAAAQASTAPVKFAVFHEPVIPVTERCWHMYRTDEANRQRLLQVLASNNLIALVGHLHRYSVVCRTTQWGPIVQIMAASVIKDRTVISTDQVITQYGPSIATDSSYVTTAATLEEREAILAAEQPYVTFYKQCSLQGFGVLNVDETTSEVVLDYYGGFSTEPFDTVDITALPIPIEIPDVVGQTRTVAESNITDTGLTVGAETNQYSSTVPAGNVISQIPASGSIATLYAPVYLVVSLGTQGPPPNIFDISVVDGRDDAEQNLADGTVHTGSSDLEIVDDNFDFGMQTVGVRFRNIPLTAGQTISKAYIQFTADPILGYSSSVTFTIQGEAADYSSAFTTAAYDISSRTKTTASVSWSPAAWTAGAAGAAEQTADITSILNEIIARPGWNANNAISLIFTGASGIRRAESYEGGAAKAPVLHIECDGDVVNNDIRFGSTITKGPYPLYKNSPNTMQIIWQTAGAEGGTIQWGPTSMYGQSAVPVSLGNNMYACTITGLQADQKVYYRVDVDGDYSRSFFYTAPDAAATHVTLYAGGDSRSMPANQDSCFGAMLADINGDESSRNTIMIYSGDMVYNGGTESDWANAWFGRSYPNSVEAQSRFPIAAGVGNHEMHSDLNCTNFRKYYPYDYEDGTKTGQDGCYYAYEYGPALILVIDLEQGCAVGSAQYNWVVNELQNSTQAFKIALYHEPAYSAGGDHADSEARMVQAREVLAPLFEAYDCLLAISGHNHYYNRSLVNGIHHITSGGFGAPITTPGTAIGQEAVEKVRHFLRIECDQSTGIAKVTVIRVYGTVLETFDVQYPTISDGSPNSAQHISNTGVPAQMIPGQTATVSITMKNTGTDTWSATNGHSLGTTSDNNFWVSGSNRIPLPKTVAPRQSVTFSFNITAPSTHGAYDFQWQMVDDTGANIGWFGDYATNVAVTVGVATPATAGWSSVTGTDHWMDDVNWSGGVAPQVPYQNLRVEFNVEGAQECILDTRAVIRQLALGDNGTSNGISLRLSSGADLVCGAKPDGGTEWTSIGYNRPSTLTMEAGAAFEAVADLLIGFDGIGDSRLDIDGGLVTVNATITLGNAANTSHGFVTVDEGGRLDASGLIFNNTNCVVDVWKGSVVLAGDQTSAVNDYRAAGNLIAYGGVGQLEVDYNLSHSGFTTISATASGYDVWAAEHGIGASNDDDDGDSRGNFYEYVMRGNPTDALDKGSEPFLLVQNGAFLYVHAHRNDDPDLVYSLESTTNLVTGIWTDAVYTVAGAIFNFGGYDFVINQLQTGDEPTYIRLKVEAP